MTRMTHDQRSRIAPRIVLAICVVACLAYAPGCRGMWQSMKSSAAPAGGAAGGAAIGLFAPPLGPIIGAAVGAVITHAIAENASLRSGEIVGDGAIEAEIKRWKGRAVVAEMAVDSAETGKAWALKWKRWLIWGAIGYLVFLRRQWIWKTITGTGVRSRFWTLVHAIVSGNKTRELAIGFDPLPKNLPTEADKEAIVARLEKSA